MRHVSSQDQLLNVMLLERLLQVGTGETAGSLFDDDLLAVLWPQIANEITRLVLEVKDGCITCSVLNPDDRRAGLVRCGESESNLSASVQRQAAACPSPCDTCLQARQ